MIWLCWIFRSADDLAMLTTWLSLSDNLGPLTIWICWYLLTIALLLMLLADNGSADNGSADNGSADNGSADNGSADNCSAEIDSANDGPCWNGCWFGSTDNLAPLTILLFWQLLLMAIALFAMTPVDDCDDENDHCCWYLCWQWIMLMLLTMALLTIDLAGNSSADDGSADDGCHWKLAMLMMAVTDNGSADVGSADVGSSHDGYADDGSSHNTANDLWLLDALTCVKTDGWNDEGNKRCVWREK